MKALARYLIKKYIYIDFNGDGLPIEEKPPHIKWGKLFTILRVTRVNWRKFVVWFVTEFEVLTYIFNSQVQITA